MATINDIIQSIIAQAKVLDPAISLDVGTPERKIVEAVAEQIAAAQLDIAVLSQQHDLDQMSGVRLDAFAQNFGFARQISVRAYGTVTLSRNTTGLSPVTIPRGTQFVCPASNSVPGLVFESLETVIIRAEELTKDISVECQTPGTIGNIPANSITSFGSSQTIGGFSSIRNANSFTGGMDGEADQDFKIRFKNTAFRHISGTTDSYLALAVAQPTTTKATVIGPQSRYIEYLQTSSILDTVQSREFDLTGSRFPLKSTTTVSTVPYSKYTYSTGYVVQRVSDNTFYKANKDYVFNIPAWADGDSTGIASNTIGPNLTLLNPTMAAATQPESEILLFEHVYMSKASRNDWFNQITNCVDLYINGADIQEATSEEPTPTQAQEIVSDKNSPFYYKNFQRTLTRANPEPDVASYLQILYFQPVVFVPETITVNNITFAKNIDYFQLRDISEYHGTVRARDGIEWTKNALTQINLQTTSFPVSYQYDSNISILQSVVEKNKQITTDVLVHKAKFRYMKLYITIMYSANSTPETVNKEIYSALQFFLGGQYFGSAIQLSDLLQTIHNVSGVDNVRWTYENQQDPVDRKKIEFVTEDGVSYEEPIFIDKDFFLDDDELADLPGTTWSDALVTVTKAQNTWNS
jgi:uncharacterized phage protein gp47/JayE